MAISIHVSKSILLQYVFDQLCLSDVGFAQQFCRISCNKIKGICWHELSHLFISVGTPAHHRAVDCSCRHVRLVGALWDVRQCQQLGQNCHLVNGKR